MVNVRLLIRKKMLKWDLKSGISSKANNSCNLVYLPFPLMSSHDVTSTS